MARIRVADEGNKKNRRVKVDGALEPCTRKSNNRKTSERRREENYKVS